MGKNNALTHIKSAKETAVKNRAAAIQKVSKDFDEEIVAYDMAIRQLSGVPAKKAAPKKAAKKVAPKKPAPKKAAKKVGPKKAAKKAAPKKIAKKAAPKKAAAKKTAAPPIPGSYPKEGTVLEKMTFVINGPKRFLNIQEIADLIKKHEPSLKPEDIKPRFGKHINKFREQGRIVSFLDKATNTVYYGLPGYMKEGKAVPGHEHAQASGSEKK
jgi:FtsZ-interacting cell division protein YlmF